jgi:hypothetical protein
MKKRYNIFNQIHKALRGMLYDAALNLQLTDFTIEEEAEGAIEKIELVLSIIYNHARDEKIFILPIIRKFDAQLSATFETEQVKNEILSQGLRAVINAYNVALNKANKEEAGDIIFKTFNEFLALNLLHMNREEAELNKVLWKHLSDEELLKISKDILAAVPPEINYIESNWMLKCTTNAEVIAWMGKIKDHAPHFVFESILDLAERVLCERRWQKIKESLSEGVLVT